MRRFTAVGLLLIATSLSAPAAAAPPSASIARSLATLNCGGDWYPATSLSVSWSTNQQNDGWNSYLVLPYSATISGCAIGTTVEIHYGGETYRGSMWGRSEKPAMAWAVTSAVIPPMSPTYRAPNVNDQLQVITSAGKGALEVKAGVVRFVGNSSVLIEQPSQPRGALALDASGRIIGATVPTNGTADMSVVAGTPRWNGTVYSSNGRVDEAWLHGHTQLGTAAASLLPATVRLKCGSRDAVAVSVPYPLHSALRNQGFNSVVVAEADCAARTAVGSTMKLESKSFFDAQLLGKDAVVGVAWLATSVVLPRLEVFGAGPSASKSTYLVTSIDPWDMGIGMAPVASAGAASLALGGAFGTGIPVFQGGQLLAFTRRGGADALGAPAWGPVVFAGTAREMDEFWAGMNVSAEELAAASRRRDDILSARRGLAATIATNRATIAASEVVRKQVLGLPPAERKRIAGSATWKTFLARQMAFSDVAYAFADEVAAIEVPSAPMAATMAEFADAAEVAEEQIAAAEEQTAALSSLRRSLMAALATVRKLAK